MPTKTNLLDHGNFVCSPELPANPAFSQYLDYADRLLGEWHKAQEDGRRSPHSSVLAARTRELDEAVRGFIDAFTARYGLNSVEQDPTFLPVSEFFARRRPFCERFSILHCDLDMPLHTVHKFQSPDDLARINAALNEDTPFAWWQSGPHHHPCYLFGNWVWELRRSEIKQSDEGITLMFLETAEKEQQKLDRLRHGHSETATTTCTDFIPEKVRILVWRRARGKCAKCGGHEGLEFDYIVPAARGGSCTPDNLQVLCNRCYEQKHGVT